MSYSRETYKPGKNKNQQPSPADAPPAAPEEPVKVDGFAQVLAMLKIADNEFRESLLKRLAARDHELALALRRELRKLDT